MQLYLATKNGFVRAEGENGRFRPAARSLDGRHCTSIVARQGLILLGTRGGIWRSADSGQTWTAAGAGLPQPHVRWLASHPTISDLDLAGMEPAALAISRVSQRWQNDLVERFVQIDDMVLAMTQNGRLLLALGGRQRRPAPLRTTQSGLHPPRRAFRGPSSCLGRAGLRPDRGRLLHLKRWRRWLDGRLRRLLRAGRLDRSRRHRPSAAGAGRGAVRAQRPHRRIP